MKEIIGYSAYNICEDAYEYNENECFIADSIESLRDFIKGAGFSVKNYRAVNVRLSDILDDYGVSYGSYCMEHEALKKFEQAARIAGIKYDLEDYDETLVNVEIHLPNKSYHPGKISSDISNDKLSAKGIQKKDDAHVISFPSYKNPFLVYRQICTNPACSNNHLNFSFVEVDHKLKPVVNPLSFSIHLDLETGEEIRPPERPERINQFVEEFLNALTEEMRGDFLSEIRSIKSDQKRLDEYRFDKRDVLDGVLVPYTAIVSEKGSIAHGGREASFGLLHKGHEYLIEDFYCSDPDCQCKKAHLQFFKKINEVSGKLTIIDCFMAEMSFEKGKMQVSQLFKSSKQEAEEVIREWKVRNPDILGLLKSRYKKVKEIGKRSLEGKGFFKIPEPIEPIVKPSIKKKKIGRNEPCPCGSGKKYKKCCGA